MGLENIWERSPKTPGSGAQILPELPDLGRKNYSLRGSGGRGREPGLGKTHQVRHSVLSPGRPGKDRAPWRSGEYQHLHFPGLEASQALRGWVDGVGCEVWAWWCYSLSAADQALLRLAVLHLQGDPGVAGLPGEKGEKVSGLRGGGWGSGGWPRGPTTW